MSAVVSANSSRDQNAMPRGDRNACNGGGRRGEREGARTGRHQHRQHGLRIVGDEPGHGCNQQHQHEVLTGVAFQPARDGRFGALRALHQGDYTSQGGLGAGAGDLDQQQTIEVDGAAEHLGSGRHFQGH
jgi:hypothetical protein